MWNIFSMPWNIFQWSLRKQFILWSASSRSKRNWVSSPKPKLIIAGIVDHICNTNTEETTRQKMAWNSMTILLIHLKKSKPVKDTSIKIQSWTVSEDNNQDYPLIVYLYTHVYKHENTHITQTLAYTNTQICAHTHTLNIWKGNAILARDFQWWTSFAERRNISDEGW